MKSTGNMLVLVVNAVKGETPDWPKIQSLILIGSLMLLILLDRLDRYVSDYMSLIQQSFRVIPEFHPLCEASLRAPPLCLSKPERASEL